ncbi:MAG TPA: ATPase, T2SS/T4P/T4SS family [Armatimonadota bacterium]|nr:ATPase, T2SS/T4P/T4SS family [Armatimonadota bacterium]
MRKRKRDEPEVAAADEVLDLKAAADFLKVSKPTFYRWLAQGKLKGFKAGQQWRFYRRDLEKFLETEEPVALQVGGDELETAVREARKARGLLPIEWNEPGQLLAPRPAEETPEESVIPRTVATIIADAIDGRASDIHIDGNPDGAHVRYRVDGVLTDAMTIPRKAQMAIVSRLKLLGDMNLAERRVPQNGRIAVKHHGRDYDVRVVTMPAMYGESAMLRILDQASVLIGFVKLGLSKPVQAAFERHLRAPQGLVIATGPSGSGRTSTLYSALNLLNSLQKKLVTIENPVEYRLRDVMQVHVNRKAGLTFPVGVRMFRYSDPDIILVGDLEDLETAELCVQAAMTGHIVLTAMMPGDAVGVITRLADMGVEPFLIGASVSAVLAQRLVRRVCQSCKAEYQPSRETLRRLGMSDDEVAGAKFYRGAGCDQCRQTGYYGRTGVFELLEVDDRLREVIARCAPAAELRAAAIEGGMVTMLRDGLEKAQQGLTTIEELLRVLAVG